MASEDDFDLIRQAFDESDGVDGRGIDLDVDDSGVLVLRGAVATPEQATAAEAAARLHVDDVRNELRVDANLREDPAAPDAGPYETPQEELQGSTLPPPSEQSDDLQTDVQMSLEENLPWDPPDRPVEVPTQGEQRGGVDRDVTVPEVADEGALDENAADETSASLRDMSAAELARSARPEHEERDT